MLKDAQTSKGANARAERTLGDPTASRRMRSKIGSVAIRWRIGRGGCELSGRDLDLGRKRSRACLACRGFGPLQHKVRLAQKDHRIAFVEDVKPLRGDIT